MIYLDNITSGQTVYIPRNESGVNPHKSGSYWDGFEDGYESGETHQKNLLSSVTFTENGEYERENGWSAVTVDVPQTGSTAILEEKTVVISADTTNVAPSSGYDGMSAVTVDASSYAQQNYDDGFDDGFTDGYASGSTDEKAKLSATTFTANTAVTISDGGYSAITVNVPQTGTSIPLSSITITENTAITETEKAYSAITVNVPQTGHTDQELEEAYESGHTEGMEDQKALLSSTAFTENGSYSRENGWSGVTVNIDTASTYNSGYTSGETHQKSLLTTTAFTQNGSYQRENGWSGVTVNVDTASTYNSGYTSGYTDGQDNIIGTFSAMTATTNGQYGSSAHPLSAITVEVPQTGTSIPLSSITFTANTSVTVTDKAFTAITVNVPQSGGSGVNYIEYIGINNPSRNTCYFELGNTGTGLDSKIVIEHSTLSKENTGFDWESWLMFCDADRGRIFVEDGTAPIQFDGRYNKNSLPYTAITDETIVLEYSGVTVGNSSFNMQYNPYEVSNCNNMVVFAAYGSEFFTSPQNQLKYGRIGTISIYDSANTLTYQYKPCLDENNVICFHEVVNDVYVYPNNGGDAYLYSGPVIDNMYESGYTDGIAYQKSLLGELTATTNGSFSAENGYSAITVNVPQAVDTITLVDYISAAQLQDDSDYRDGIELGNIWATDTEFRIKGWMTGNYTGQGVLTNYDGGEYPATRWFWVGGNMYYDLNSDRISVVFTPTSGTAFDYTINNWGVYDNLTSSYVMSGSPKQSINAGVAWLNMCTCKISSIEVKQGNNVILNGLAAFDSNNHIGLYDTVSGQMLYNSGLSMTYGTVLGTIDYLSGYTDGQNSIINTFSSMTATTNGQYGSTAHPMTAITVNVPSSLTKKLYVFANNQIKQVDYYEESLYQWNIINENYTTSSPLEIMYVHYNNNKLHVYLLSDGKYGYWDEDEYDPQPVSSITTINESAYVYDGNNSYTLTESGTGLVVTASYGAYYEVLVCTEAEGLGVGSFSANGTYNAIDDNYVGYSAVTVNVDTASTWNDGYDAGLGELFCLYCENASFNIGESSSEAEFDDVYISLLTLSGFNITVGGGGRSGQLVATDSGSTLGFVGYWQTSGNTYTTPVTSIAKGTIPTGMVSVGITDYGPIVFHVDSTSATSSGGVKIPTGSYSLSFSGDSFYLGPIRRNAYYNCFTPYVDNDGNACMIGPNSTLVYPTSGTCYAVYKKVTKNGDYVYYMNKEVGRVTQ